MDNPIKMDDLGFPPILGNLYVLVDWFVSGITTYYNLVSWGLLPPIMGNMVSWGFLPPIMGKIC
jgi:hypothetical protein